MKVTLENKEHNTKAELQLREDIIQPGVYKDLKKHLCKCGGKCGCQELGHTHSSHHVCTCRDTQGETYGLVWQEDTDKE